MTWVGLSADASIRLWINTELNRDADSICGSVSGRRGPGRAWEPQHVVRLHHPEEDQLTQCSAGGLIRGRVVLPGAAFMLLLVGAAVGGRSGVSRSNTGYTCGMTIPHPHVKRKADEVLLPHRAATFRWRN